MRFIGYRVGISVALTSALISSVLMAPQSHAAPTLAEIQLKVRQLEEDATAAAEGAQEAKVKIAALTKTLTGIKQKAAVQGQNVSEL